MSQPILYICIQKCKGHIQISKHFTNMPESDKSPYFTKPRLVQKEVLASSEPEDGAILRKCIGRTELASLDPFLSLVQFEMSAPAGYPNHPHRGFEMVTYMLEGAFTQEILGGHKGTIGPGDMHWLTAGRGIIHSEMPAREGTTKGLQLWINLPSKDKMIEASFQELPREEIHKAERDGVEVKVIAGEAMGARSRVRAPTPTMFLDFTLKPGSELHQGIQESWNAFVYVIEGEGVFGTRSSLPVGAHRVLVLGCGDGVSVWNKSLEPLRFVLIGGEPLGEAVVQFGPFVMNTQIEIDEAFEDYKQCRNGFEVMAKHGMEGIDIFSDENITSQLF